MYKKSRFRRQDQIKRINNLRVIRWDFLFGIANGFAVVRRALPLVVITLRVMPM